MKIDDEKGKKNKSRKIMDKLYQAFLFETHLSSLFCTKSSFD